MAAEFRMTRWRLLGVAIAASVYLVLPWAAGWVSHEFRLLLIVPIAAAFAGALVLIFFHRPEPSQPLLRTEAPPVPLPMPWWLPLLLTLHAALVTWTRDGGLGETGDRLMILVLISSSVWYAWYRIRRARPQAH
jgi:hypothetical protein